MPTVTVEDPYTGEMVPVELPDGAELKEVKESYRTGIWGRAKKVEVKSSDGHTFAVTYS